MNRMFQPADRDFALDAIIIRNLERKTTVKGGVIACAARKSIV